MPLGVLLTLRQVAEGLTERPSLACWRLRGGFGTGADSAWTTEVWISVKLGVFKHRLQLGFAEAEPLVGVELAGFFKAMLDQVEDDDADARNQNPVRFAHGAICGIALRSRRRRSS
jgi:hypothetical protein